jgi:hypothetical protein
MLVPPAVKAPSKAERARRRDSPPS